MQIKKWLSSDKNVNGLQKLRCQIESFDGYVPFKTEVHKIGPYTRESYFNLKQQLEMKKHNFYSVYDVVYSLVTNN